MLRYYYILMSSTLQKQMLIKLKKQSCQQQDCRSNNQDNVQLLVFGDSNAKKSGLMCSQCFVDSCLLKQLCPLEKYVLPIRKYLNILINYHKSYVELKSSLSWGPNIVDKQSESTKRKIESFYNDQWKFILEVTQYADLITKKATEDLKKVYQDYDFDKILEYLNEQNELQQQRMNLSNQLTHVCKNIKVLQGKHHYAPEEHIKKQANEIVLKYRWSMQRVIGTLKELNEVQKDCFRNMVS